MPPSATSTEPRPGGRDEVWFEQLFRAEYAPLCAFAARYVDHRHIAEEIVQEAFLKLWMKRAEPADGALRTYLFRIVRNGCFDYLKRRRVRAGTAPGPDPDDLPVSETPEVQLQFIEAAREVEQAISELPERRREIFVLSRDAGLTYAEIASTLEISIKTVETQMSRALRFLRHRLHPLLALLLLFV